VRCSWRTPTARQQGRTALRRPAIRAVPSRQEHNHAERGHPLAIKPRGLLVIGAMGCAVLPALSDVIRKQDEALAYLHKRRTLGRIAYHLGGVRAGVCFLQIDARVCHEAEMRSLENGSIESMEPDIHVRR
jgi:hypothetical protein